MPPIPKKGAATTDANRDSAPVAVTAIRSSGWRNRKPFSLKFLIQVSCLQCQRELWAIFRRNRHLLHDLPALGAAVIEQSINMKYGAKALIVVVQHTFGGDLKFNCHLHILVSVGGLQKSTGQWVPRLDLSEDALMKMWRYAVINHLRCALKVGVLKSQLDLRDLKHLLANAYSSERHPRWIVYLDAVVSKAHFLGYMTRYVRRPPIAKWRIRKVTEKEVEFVAKDTKKGKLVPTRCTSDRFVRLLAAHVPDHYRHGIRYFGLLAPRVKNQHYAGLFIRLGQRTRPRPQRLSWRESMKKYFGLDPMIDSLGQEMHWV